MFNPDLHAHLVDLGYALTEHPADWYDGGDAENGPRLEGGPAWDEYESPDDRIVITERYGVEMWEKRDLEFEAWCDLMAGSPETEQELAEARAARANNGGDL